MVKIRLRRVGAKKQPHYRVVVADSQSPRDGKFIETIGYYNPRTEPPTMEIDAQRALYWLSVGAQPSEAVKRMLDRMGIMSQVTDLRRGEVSIEEIVAQFKAEQVAQEVAVAKAKAVEEEPEVELSEDEEQVSEEEAPEAEILEVEVSEAEAEAGEAVLDVEAEEEEPVEAEEEAEEEVEETEPAAATEVAEEPSEPEVETDDDVNEDETEDDA
jgi:small subunit ribosomal protein S16